MSFTVSNKHLPSLTNKLFIFCTLTLFKFLYSHKCKYRKFAQNSNLNISLCVQITNQVNFDHLTIS